MSNQRGGFRFRIPWLGAAPAPRPMTTENQTSRSETALDPNQVTSPIAPTGSQFGLGPAVSRTLGIAPSSGIGSVPSSPPPSPPPRQVPMSPRTVFSPRLIPRLANDQFVTTTQLTTSLQSSPPPSLPASLPSSPTRPASQPSVLSTPRQTPPRYHSASPPSLPSSPTRVAPQPSAASTPPRYFSISPTVGLAHDRKAASPVPETKKEPSPRTRFLPQQTPEPISKNNTEFQTGTILRPISTKVEPHLPSEKVVSENPIIAPPKPQPELEKRPKDQTNEGNKKSEKGKGPLKEEKSKANPKLGETRGRSRRATYTYTFHGKPPIKTRPPPQPPQPPPPPPPPLPPSLQKSIKEDVSKLIHDLTTGQPKKYQIGETLVDMVTLAGENKGAMMTVGSEAKKEKSIHIHREYKTDPNASNADDEDDDVNEKFNQTEEEESEVDHAFVNSNVQGVNNSMVIDSSVSEKNPGVHMAISVADIEEEELFPAPETLPETRRAEFNPTLSQKLTYDQPMVKRRCLRGLFMESSDSDDPTKPRRHGCRYGCGDKKSKDKGKGISGS